MGNQKNFRKYGQIFDEEGTIQTPPEPESPYEPLPYKPPGARGKSLVEREQDELSELRGSSNE